MDDFEQDVIERLTRIEEQLKPLADHEMRLRAVETKTTMLSGGVALLAPVLAWLGYHVTLH